MKEIAEILRLWRSRCGASCALATLVQTQGSSYRGPGARMLIAPDRASAGSLSGGCLEEEVADAGLDVLRSGESVLMEFDTRRRFGCHGRIAVFVERASESFLPQLEELLQERRSCRAVTVFIPEAEWRGTRILRPDEEVPAGAFLQEIVPPLQLLIFGDGPDSAPLRAFAEILGWAVIECEGGAGLPNAVDARTAAVVKSHNYGRDCAALRQLLQLGLPYVGLLGPRRRRDELIGDLLDSGVVLASELFAPAGLDLRAETPEEIALAIVAEIQGVFAEGSGESLRDRKAPIHGWKIAPPANGITAACEVSAR
ncbi:MAG: XdhC family protein [Chthoniobacterales bacterium]